MLLKYGFAPAQADALGFGIDVKHLAAYHVANVDLVFHLGNALYANLRYMDKAINSGLKSHKRAEGNDADNFAFYYAAYGILLIRHSPGLGLELLIAQGYALLFNINVPYKHLDLLAY